MHRYLIKVEEKSSHLALKEISDSIRGLGSHFATHAEWSLKKGGCMGSLIVEAKDQFGALGIVPPNMRDHAHITNLEMPAGTQS